MFEQHFNGRRRPPELLRLDQLGTAERNAVVLDSARRLREELHRARLAVWEVSATTEHETPSARALGQLVSDALALLDVVEERPSQNGKRTRGRG